MRSRVRARATRLQHQHPRTNRTSGGGGGPHILTNNCNNIVITIMGTPHTLANDGSNCGGPFD
jgi:hypothetical protein